MKRLVAALGRRPLDRPPVWVMRQAGRYLPEYRELRSRWSFPDAVRTPEIATELTLQPLRRFPLDAAIVFADIMTPLQAMGLDVVFDPGPKLTPLTLDEVLALPELEPEEVGFVGETIRRVVEEVPDDVAVVGFAGAPATLLAYLLEGGGSRDLMALRTAVHREPRKAAAALRRLGEDMRRYLTMQIDAGADVVQLFDSWVGALSVDRYVRLAAPAAAVALDDLDAPTIYFAPHATHLLPEVAAVGADGYGVDWRLPLDEAWRLIGDDHAVQGNLDPAVLLTDPDSIRAAVADLLARAGGRPGHVVNLGHGIDRSTPPEHLGVLVEAVQEGAL